MTLERPLWIFARLSSSEKCFCWQCKQLLCSILYDWFATPLWSEFRWIVGRIDCLTLIVVKISAYMTTFMTINGQFKAPNECLCMSLLAHQWFEMVNHSDNWEEDEEKERSFSDTLSRCCEFFHEQSPPASSCIHHAVSPQCLRVQRSVWLLHLPKINWISFENGSLIDEHNLFV